MKKICLFCKKSFNAYGLKAKFCNRFCSDKGRTPKIMVICKNCRKEFRDIDNKKSKPRKFCSPLCFQKYEIGEKNPAWKGGKIVNYRGYIALRIGNRYILEHRFVVEKHFGRTLKNVDIVHHINGIKTDNRIENLVLTNRSEHNKIDKLIVNGGLKGAKKRKNK